MVRAAAGRATSVPAKAAARNQEEGIVSHKKALLIVAVALSTVVLAGFVSVSLSPGLTASHHPNDRANHQPLHPKG